MARLGIISAYPDEDWHARRIVAAARRCADTRVLSPLDFSAEMGIGGSRLLVCGEPRQRYAAFLTPRAIGDEGDHELQLELYRTLAEDGALLVNDVRALTVAIDKFKTSWLLARAGLSTPRVIVVQRPDEADAALASLRGVAVAKPLYGSLGIGVELVSSRRQLEDCFGRWRALYLQEFVPSASGEARDVRAFVVGGRVEAAIARVAPAGEFRTNVHQGGRVEAVRLGGASERLAVAAAALLGLHYAGVDLIEGKGGPTVLEVNGTPLFRGIYEATGRDMAVPIVDLVLQLVDEAGASRRHRKGRASTGRE